MSAKSRINKMTRWILLFALVVSGLTAGGAGYYLNRTDNAKRELANFILAHSESTAVAAYTFDENGEFVADGYALFHNADAPLVLASTVKIVVLAAYADAVANGELDPDERIPIADVEKYYLPMTDGNAHIMGLQSVGLQTDDDGFARDQAATLTLDDVARMMMDYSGNAETDYLITRLGPEKIASVIQKTGLEHHTPIGLTLGVALTIFNHEEPSFSTRQLQSVIAEISTGDTSHFDRLTGLYLHDPQWRAAQIQFMNSINEQSVGGVDMWMYQTVANQLLPKGTVREYAKMMAQIASRKFISPKVSELMQQKLENVPSDWPLRVLFYDRFGAKDGVTAGVLTVASYAVPKRGPLSQQARVVVLITTQLPVEDWTEQLNYQGHYVLAIDLAQATGTFAQLAGAGNE